MSQKTLNMLLFGAITLIVLMAVPFMIVTFSEPPLTPTATPTISPCEGGPSGIPCTPPAVRTPQPTATDEPCVVDPRTDPPPWRFCTPTPTATRYHPGPIGTPERPTPTPQACVVAPPCVWADPACEGGPVPSGGWCTPTPTPPALPPHPYPPDQVSSTIALILIGIVFVVAPVLGVYMLLADAIRRRRQR